MVWFGRILQFFLCNNPSIFWRLVSNNKDHDIWRIKGYKDYPGNNCSVSEW